MRKTLLLLAALAAVLPTVAGCSNSNPDYDPDLCDFWQAMGEAHEAMEGITPAADQVYIDKYCTLP